MGAISDKIQSACDEAIALLDKEIAVYDREIESGKYSAEDILIMRGVRNHIHDKMDRIFDFKYDIGEYIKSREK